MRDPRLWDFPYKVETNERGRIILSPDQNRHSKKQKAVLTLLAALLSRGKTYPKYALATSHGVKAPDVVWMIQEREEAMDATGDPSTLVPEICAEILGVSNTEAEMAEKRRAYREAGADEVWLVSEDGDIRFFADDELDRSALAPACPPRVMG